MVYTIVSSNSNKYVYCESGTIKESEDICQIFPEKKEAEEEAKRILNLLMLSQKYNEDVPFIPKVISHNIKFHFRD